MQAVFGGNQGSSLEFALDEYRGAAKPADNAVTGGECSLMCCEIPLVFAENAASRFYDALCKLGAFARNGGF